MIVGALGGLRVGVDEGGRQPGQRVQPGESLLAVVPLDDVWVTANFKEDQLRRMRPGQSVDIHVDALYRSSSAA